METKDGAQRPEEVRLSEGDTFERLDVRPRGSIDAGRKLWVHCPPPFASTREHPDRPSWCVALSIWDSTHNFVASYNCTIPVDRLFGALPKRVTQGWSLNGITRFATGFPISISQSGDRSLTGAGGVDRPDYIGGLVITPDVRNTPNHTYFNKGAFVSEGTSVTTANGGLGIQRTSNVRFFHGPGINNFDLSAQKITRMHESMSILVRAEFFNALEHAQFNSPSGSFTSSSFGSVTSARSAGRIGQVSLKFLW